MGESWDEIPMFCPNCGHLNHGYRNRENTIRYECTRCKVVLVRTVKGRRHDTIDLYAPNGQERFGDR